MNTKISALPAGNPAQAGDIVPIDRAGANFGITAGSIAALAGAGSIKTARSVPTAFTQGGVTGPIAVTFSTPFADNNYTVQVTIVCQEAAPGTPTVTQFPSAGDSYVNLQAAGAGVNVWVANNDSIAHTGYVEVIAIHD